jgi:hypothetical protein
LFPFKHRGPLLPDAPGCIEVGALGPKASLADSIVRRFGGRCSSELGIDVDAGDAEVERWFLASTLFGTRISARIAERTFYDSPMAWAMLVGQPGRSLRAIGDAHVLRGETEMAKALVDRQSAELTELQQRFETSSTRELVPGERTQEDRAVAAMDEILERQPEHHRGRGPSQDGGTER